MPQRNDDHIEDDRGHSHNRPGYLRRQVRFYFWRIWSQTCSMLFYLGISSVLRYGPNSEYVRRTPPSARWPWVGPAAARLPAVVPAVCLRDAGVAELCVLCYFLVLRRSAAGTTCFPKTPL